MTAVFAYTVLYFVLFGFAEALYHFGKWHAEKTRKVVHVGTGLLALTFPRFLEDFWQVAILCISFLLLMGVSEKFHWFRSITGVERRSYGSWLFALVVMLCFYLQLKFEEGVYYYFPLLVLSISDPLAALVGKSKPIKVFRVFGQQKSLGGSLAFLVSATVIGFSYFSLVDQSPSWILLLLASVGAAWAEFCSIKGWDNLTIPLSIILVLKLLL